MINHIFLVIVVFSSLCLAANAQELSAQSLSITSSFKKDSDLQLLDKEAETEEEEDDDDDEDESVLQIVKNGNSYEIKTDQSEEYQTILLKKQDIEPVEAEKTQITQLGDEAIFPSEENTASEKSFTKEEKLQFAYAQDQYEYINQLMKDDYLELAVTKSKELIDWVNSAAESHFELFKIFNVEDSSSYRSKEKFGYATNEKTLALEFARLRDEALMQRAKIFIKQKSLQEAVEPLVKLIKSQPNTELAQEAYKLLEEIGFSKNGN